MTVANQVLRFHCLFTSLTFTLIHLSLSTCFPVTDGLEAVSTFRDISKDLVDLLAFSSPSSIRDTPRILAT